MLMRIIKVLIGLFLLPITAVQTKAFASQLTQIQGVAGLSGYFLKGIIVYLIIHLFLWKPNYFYVLGHELAHALATVVCGGQVRSLRVSSSGGGVATTKSNSFIALFPYFFPTYTLFFWLAYFLCSLFRDVSEFKPLFLFLVGFSLTLHLVMTVESLRGKQTDILKTGYLFSLGLIYLLNIFLVSLILSLVFKEFSFSSFFYTTVDGTTNFYYAIYRYLFL